ncbi:MAG: 16S rRNA (cytosine(1402)-N(4))-methyltransferase RsmH [Candidatus Dasytiphilus stammeri]
MPHLIKHNPVLLNEAVNALNIKDNGIYIDCTFGSGGHARMILNRLSSEGQLYAIDRDPQAIEASKCINDNDPRLTIIHGCFSRISSYMEERQLIGRIDGILLDLGLSSGQINNADRGFSFWNDGPLDMRMDPTQSLSAAAWLFNATEHDITVVLKNYGEERFARRIARAIIKRRNNCPITRTKELVEVITSLCPKKFIKKHPARRSFQAIRIFINNELTELRKGLEGSLKCLRSSGRLSVISFHSLEDRLVKSFIRHQSRCCFVSDTNGYLINEHRNSGIFIGAGGGLLKAIGKIKPSRMEIAMNHRARSAILRTAERTEHVIPS